MFSLHQMLKHLRSSFDLKVSLSSRAIGLESALVCLIFFFHSISLFFWFVSFGLTMHFGSTNKINCVMSQVNVENTSMCSSTHCPACASKCQIYCPSGICWLTFCRHNMEIEYFKGLQHEENTSQQKRGHPFAQYSHNIMG